jgi:hypothetical protein
MISFKLDWGHTELKRIIEDMELLASLEGPTSVERNLLITFCNEIINHRSTEHSV